VLLILIVFMGLVFCADDSVANTGKFNVIPRGSEVILQDNMACIFLLLVHSRHSSSYKYISPTWPRAPSLSVCSSWSD